jgi:phosphatidylinositol alpha-mannosyltransferase
MRDLSESLIRQGHEVSVLAPFDGEGVLPDYVVDGGRPVAVAYNGSVARLNFGWKATRRVRKWIQEGDFDVLHVHEPLSPSLSVLACWVAQGPIVATWHSSMARSRALSAVFYLAQISMEKVSARIAVSEEARRTLVAHIGGDAVLIANGVTVANFADPATLPGYPRSGGTLGFLGRLDEPRKGFDVLVRAVPALVARFPDLRVLVAGPGDPEEALGAVAAEFRDHFIFLGRVSDADKVRMLHSIDAFIAPNTGGESFGIVLLEAMASGAPVVSSDLLAFRRVLDEGRYGRTFSTGDPQALASVTSALLEDPDARKSMSTAGYERARHFDWERVGREVVAVYESVVLPGVKVREDLRGQIVGRLARSKTNDVSES